MTSEVEVLENALEQWEAPDAPEGLLDRCLGTVPSGAQKERGRVMLVARFLGTAFAVTAVAIMTTNPMRNWRNQTITASAAFAESARRSADTPYWTQVWRNTDGSQAHFWFDQSQGYAMENADKQRKNRILYLPNGDKYHRTDWKTIPGLIQLSITHQGVKEWAELKQHAIYQKNRDPLTSLANGGRDEHIKEKTMSEGIYQGKGVRVFTIVSQFDQSTDEARPLRRMTYYADKETERFIAIREESAPIGKPLEVTGECEVRYERPDTSVFNALRLKEGAKETIESWPRSSNPNHRGPRMLLNGREFIP